MKINHYDVYVKDYKNKVGEFIGSIPERRQIPRIKGAMIDLPSALTYARMTFGAVVSDLHSIYVIPREL
jgi:hypothetical protein